MKKWIKKLLCFHYWINDYEWYGNYHQYYKCNKCNRRKICHGFKWEYLK